MYIFRIFRRRRRRAATEAEKARFLPVRQEASTVLPGRMAALAQKYGFQYNRLFLKHNRTNWGSCSTKNNINLNITLVLLPQEICTLVMLHELCHLRHFNHSKDSHALLDSLCIQETGFTEKELAARLRPLTPWTAEKRRTV